MKKKLIGHVSAEEMKEIQLLYERKNGLVELARVLSTDNQELYERLVSDLGETQSKFQNWWIRMSQLYNWESVDGGNWEIDFDSCNIFLVVE
jgi:CXXX repeat modification system protein